MKQPVRLLSFLLLVILVATGCQKTDTNTNVNPDVSSFSMVAGGSVSAGSAATIAVNSTSLGTGVFTVHFDLTGANLGLDLTSSLYMTGGAGTFVTPKLAAAGTTTLTLNSITNAAGYSAQVAGGNKIAITTSTAHDSNGYMNATIGTTSFRATDMSTTIAGGTLVTVTGTVWDPAVSSIVLYVKRYAHSPTSFSFSIDDTTYDRGSAIYYKPGGTSVNAAHGTIALTSVSPALVGTFSFTTVDSARVSGSFSAPAP
jgi:hypothetical protein